jgi:hypothetical protein
MQETEQKYRELIANQVLKDIRFYNINENYMVFEPNHKWVIEGGIEIIFEDHTVCLGWNADMQLYDIVKGEIKELTGEFDIYELDFSEYTNVTDLPGKKIKDLTFNWTWYQKMDENMELVEEKTYIPQELLIKFEDDTLLQIATIVFQLRDKQIEKPVFDSQSMILITINQHVQIQEVTVNVDLEKDDY